MRWQNEERMRSWKFLVMILFSPLVALSQTTTCEFPKLVPFCIFPKPFKMSRLVGRVSDAERGTIPDSCVSLFDPGHRLVSAVRTDIEGRFVFHSIADGKYVLVTNYSGFTPAIAELVVGRRGSRRMLHIHMVLSGIDTCSNVDLKK
jgi:hypothetical protein